MKNLDTFTKPDKKTLKEKLSKTQYYVTQKDGTEKPFKNEYWDNNEQGIYVDILSGEPLFCSTHKYKSGTGWPSFSDTISPESVTLKKDRTLLFRVRTEVRSKIADCHLGHVFDDGPSSTGKRYCMNSAALKFIPKEKMEEEGFKEFLHLFEEPKNG